MISGYPMATNLAKKLSKGDTVLVFDVNSTATARFVDEALSSKLDTSVEAVSSAREAAERSVSCLSHIMK